MNTKEDDITILEAASLRGDGKQARCDMNMTSSNSTAEYNGSALYCADYAAVAVLMVDERVLSGFSEGRPGVLRIDFPHHLYR